MTEKDMLMALVTYPYRDHAAILVEGGLVAVITYYAQVGYACSESHVLRVYRQSDVEQVGQGYPGAVYVQSFGSTDAADRRCLELMEYPSWTLLKFG